ncbi:MAG: FtsW/RodA/SpoVE family cell cycle protein [Paludibacteraceae bacterium]|nr:FtsW/RodA/SpoVE family cell cycle protein [Paludibacteraceae bacterium]
MQKFLSTYIKGDKIIWGLVITMMLISAFTMYSASSSLAHKAASRGGYYYAPVWSHVLFLLGGLAVVFFVHRIPFRFIIGLSKPFYFISIILLILTPLIGVEANGAKRWLQIGPILFQPSELAKLFTILFLASALAKYQNQKNVSPDDGLLKYLLILGVPSVIIATENLSTFILLMMIGFMMMFYARLSFKLILKMIGVGALAVALGVGALMLIPEESTPAVTSVSAEQTAVSVKPRGVFHRALTWKHRIMRHFEEDQPHDENYKLNDQTYQEDRAKIAVASGKWFGLGIGNSIQRDFLPLAYADFIFSLMVEEVGVLALFVLLLYLIFLYRVGVLIRQYCNSVVQSLVVLGLSSMIMVQTYINVFIAVGLFPVSGQPLPLYSRGGTSILITCLYFGIILCVSNEAMSQSALKKEEKTSAPKKKETKEEPLELEAQTE